MKSQKLLIEDLIKSGSFNNNLLELITGHTENKGKLRKPCFKTKTGIPYPLFKLHKLSLEQIRQKIIPPARLVHSLTQSPTTRLEKYLAHVFGEISRNYVRDEYIKDTGDFLNIVRSTPIKKGDLIFSLDVKRLYPSMKLEIVMESVHEDLHEDTTLAVPIKSGIAPCIAFCLENSCLEYRGDYYRAIKGVPTGGSISRPLADTFMGYIKNILKSRILNWDQIIKLWKRFIDDIFGIWRGTADQFFEFVTLLNQEAAVFGIEFTGDVGTKLSFLDVCLEIKVEENGYHYLDTSLYQKPTDNRSFLQRNSYHAPHTFSSVPYSQLLRARNICSTEDTFELGAEEIMRDLRSSGYTDVELTAAYEKVVSTERDQLKTLTSDNNSDSNSCQLVLVTHYFKELTKIKKFLHQKQQYISHIVGQPTSLIVANRRHNNISDMLFTRRQFTTVSERNHEQASTSNTNGIVKTTDQKCHRPRCKSCDLMGTMVNGGMMVNGQWLKLDSHLNCSDSNVIYVAQCRHCLPGFYIGQTWQNFSCRVSKHRSAFNSGKLMDSSLALHISEKHNSSFSDKLKNFNFGIIMKSNVNTLDMYEDIFIEKTKARI